MYVSTGPATGIQGSPVSGPMGAQSVDPGYNPAAFPLTPGVDLPGYPPTTGYGAGAPTSGYHAPAPSPVFKAAPGYPSPSAHHPNIGYQAAGPSPPVYKAYHNPAPGYPPSHQPNPGYPSPHRSNSGYPSAHQPSHGYPSPHHPNSGFPSPHQPNPRYPSPHHPNSGYASPAQQPSPGLRHSPHQPDSGYLPLPQEQQFYMSNPPDSTHRRGFPDHDLGYPGSHQPRHSSGYTNNQPSYQGHQPGYNHHQSSYQPNTGYTPTSNYQGHQPNYQPGYSNPQIGYRPTPIPPQKSYAPQPNSYASQPNSYAPQPNSHAPQPNSYRPTPQPNDYAPQPNSYAPQPNSYAPQPNSHAPHQSTYAAQPIPTYPQQSYPQQSSYPRPTKAPSSLQFSDTSHETAITAPNTGQIHHLRALYGSHKQSQPYGKPQGGYKPQGRPNTPRYRRPLALSRPRRRGIARRKLRRGYGNGYGNQYSQRGHSLDDRECKQNGCFRLIQHRNRNVFKSKKETKGGGYGYYPKKKRKHRSGITIRPHRPNVRYDDGEYESLIVPFTPSYGKTSFSNHHSSNKYSFHTKLNGEAISVDMDLDHNDELYHGHHSSPKKRHRKKVQTHYDLSPSDHTPSVPDYDPSVPDFGPSIPDMEPPDFGPPDFGPPDFDPSHHGRTIPDDYEPLQHSGPTIIDADLHGFHAPTKGRFGFAPKSGPDEPSDDILGEGSEHSSSKEWESSEWDYNDDDDDGYALSKMAPEQPQEDIWDYSEHESEDDGYTLDDDNY